MAQPELERRRAVSEHSALSGGDFQGIGSFAAMMGWGAAQEARSGAADHRLDEPSRLPSAWLDRCRGASVSPSRVIVAQRRSLLKCKRHRPKIDGGSLWLGKKVHSQVSIEKLATGSSQP